MLNWLKVNIGAIIVCAILILIVAGVIISMIRDKKKGKSSCGCGCSGCPMSGSCHSKK
ncbi:MAG: FeoB-associated Cys-rich membrane protein [Candidatus Ornithospirochaeta sp.]